MLQLVIEDAEEKMEKAVNVFQDELKGVRTGQATPSLVENITVDYHGSDTSIQELASIAVPDARMLMIKPFDPSSLEAIEKAIIKSDLGLTPDNDGQVIRLQIPKLSEERREQLVDRASELAEEARVSIRNIRRDAIQEAEELEEEGEISEDAFYRAKDEIQEITDEHSDKIDDLLESKTNQIREM
jgi:ribosome recycling factor